MSVVPRVFRDSFHLCYCTLVTVGSEKEGTPWWSTRPTGGAADASVGVWKIPRGSRSGRRESRRILRKERLVVRRLVEGQYRGQLRVDCIEKGSGEIGR